MPSLHRVSANNAVFFLACAAPQYEYEVVTVSSAIKEDGEQQRTVAHFKQPYSTSFFRSRAALRSSLSHLQFYDI